MTSFQTLLVFALAGAALAPASSRGVPANVSGARGTPAWPLSAFEENRGQFDAEVLLACRTGAYTAAVTANAFVVSVGGPAGEGGEGVRRFTRASESGEVRPFGEQPAPIHYFLSASGGSFRHVEAALYAGVRYENVEPGVDLQLYCGGTGLEYQWIQRAGTGNPARGLPWEGAEDVMRPHESLSRTAVRDGVLPTVRTAPVGGRDAAIGGTSSDSAYAVAVDSAGNVYITGETWSGDFPATMRTAGRRGKDVFIAKLNSAADTLLYAAVIGGSEDDAGKAIAVDVSGNVFVAGTTGSTDFPVTSGVGGAAYGGARDGFVLKLDATGSRLLYSTYLGGSGEDAITGIAIDAAGAVYATGYTASRNFPLTAGALQTSYGGGFYDAFATKINPDARTLGYSTFLGGSGTDTARAIAVDAAGCAYLTGATDSTNFPVRSAFQASAAGGGDAFVAKVNATGTALVYSTYLGGRSLEYGTAVAVDAGGAAYVAGPTMSQDFPMGATSLRRTNRGDYDVFVAALDASGLSLTASTYLGGSDSEEPAGITVDAGGAVYVAGYTRSGDFLLPEAGNWPYHGGEDVFVVKLRRTLDALLEAECFGGAGDDRATSIAVDKGGRIFLAGRSDSPGFPGQRIGTGGAGDAFVIKVEGPNHPPVTVSVTPSSGSGFQQTFQFTVADPDGAADLFGLMILINPASGGKGCVVYYDRVSALVALADDSLAFPWAGYVGTVATLENTRCAITLSGASASASGTNLILTLPITFKTGLAGRQWLYLFTQDKAGAYAGWDARGSWDVPSVNRPPSTVSVTPSTGSGSSQTFTFTAADPDGAGDLSGIVIRIGQSYGNACVLFYDPVAGIVALADDNLAFPWAGRLGASVMIENARCAVALGGAAASASTTNLSVTLPVTFKSAFAGHQPIFLFTQDRAGAYAGWDQRGSWDVPAGNRAPSTISVTPSGAGGTSQTFTFTVADPDGAADLFGMMVLITGTGSSANACALFYDRARGTLALADDTGAGYTAAGALGSPATLQNNQCVVALSPASASALGSTLNLSAPITFKSAFRGSKNIYLFTQDRAGAWAGWDARGSWNVP